MNLSNRVMTSVLALAVLLAPGLDPAPARSSTEDGQEADQAPASGAVHKEMTEQAVISAVLGAVSTWDLEGLLPLLAEQNKPDNNADLDQAFAALYAQVGTMTWHAEPVLESADGDTPRSWRIQAGFQGSPALITLKLAHESGRHAVVGLYVDFVQQQTAAL